MKIYVNFPIPKTPIEFLERFYSTSYEPPPVGYNWGVSTFEDEACTILQCGHNRIRSFDDLWDIITTYYPDITLKDFMHDILRANIPVAYYEKKSLGYPQLATCNDIRRIRLLYTHGILGDEYYDKKMSDSKYTWRELLALVGVTTFVEMREYVEKHRALRAKELKQAQVKEVVLT